VPSPSKITYGPDVSPTDVSFGSRENQQGTVVKWLGDLRHGHALARFVGDAGNLRWHFGIRWLDVDIDVDVEFANPPQCECVDDSIERQLNRGGERWCLSEDEDRVARRIDDRDRWE
jgi:hypothetical protein